MKRFMKRLTIWAGAAALTSVLALGGVARGDDSTTTTTTTTTTATFTNKSTLSYGVTLSLLQFSVARRADQPARLRDYQPQLQVLPVEIGFQFVYGPQYTPWRFTTSDRSKPFQLMTVGGAVLTRIQNEGLSQGNISLAAELGFFENTISIGIGFDLYRGIPTLNGSGVAGGATAYTGLLAAAFAKEGEVTPENVFVLLSFSLSKLTAALTSTVH